MGRTTSSDGEIVLFTNVAPSHNVVASCDCLLLVVVVVGCEMLLVGAFVLVTGVSAGWNAGALADKRGAATGKVLP